MHEIAMENTLQVWLESHLRKDRVTQRQAHAMRQQSFSSDALYKWPVLHRTPEDGRSAGYCEFGYFINDHP